MQRIGKPLRIGIIDVPEKTGGRHTFVRNFYTMLHSLGHEVRVIDIHSVSISGLSNFDVLHFSDPFQVTVYYWKIALARPAVKILTTHGWIIEETMFSLRERNSLARARAVGVMGSLVPLISWITFTKPFATNFLFAAITCPSPITAEKNGIKNAIIIRNPIFSEVLDRTRSLDMRQQPNEVLFATYVSIGGVKVGYLPRLIRVVEKLNDKIENRKITLLVFGKLSKKYATHISSPCVRVMGFSDEFLNVLKGCDLFCQGAPSSELGFTAIEAGILGVPVAKFTDRENCKFEELTDGVNGIVAFNEGDMIGKLFAYVSDLDHAKKRMGCALRSYFLKTRNWFVIAQKWVSLFNRLLSTNGKKIES